MAEDICDIVVLGAGPAGAAAAAFAAQRGLKTAVVERSYSEVGEPHVEWLHPDAAAALDAIEIPTRSAMVGAVDRVQFVDATCSRQARTEVVRKVHLVDSAKLAREMLSYASGRGAELHTGQVVSVEVHERQVTLVADNGLALTGRILVAADGPRSLAAQTLGLSPGPMPPRLSECGQAFHVAAKPTAWSEGRGRATELTVFIESNDLASYGYALTTGAGQVLGLVGPAPGPGLRDHLASLATTWQNAGLVSIQQPLKPAAFASRLVPRGLALEADTHVSKNAVFIGDAGGFVAAVSHEGLYPAIESARLAVETCVEALQSPHPQDTLIDFDSRWRREMAEYLRLPNSDLRFLLPLAFSNPRMARKLADAFLLGINI